MGNYATTAQLQARFEDTAEVAALTDTADSGTPDSAVLTEVLDGAEGRLDGYIGTQHRIPVDVASDTVLANFMRTVTLDVAEYKLLARHNIVPESKLLAFDAAIQWAKDVGSGDAVLPAAAAQPSTEAIDPTAAHGFATGSSSTRRFTRATQGGL
ncbi:hypothetical protein LCGC14_0943310 [marine sediment metagenome]|uniref:DUF1320 domain-containing protein n=1 Tax=marine sediment metagenome TaxID=412755 RepID=A0A0F9P5I1_9ZZZZ